MSGFCPFSRLRLMLAIVCLGFLPGCATGPDDTAPAAGEEVSDAQTMDLARMEREPITRLAFVDAREKNDALRAAEEAAVDAALPKPEEIETASGEEPAKP